MERLLAEVGTLEADTLQVSAMPSFASKWVAPRLARFIADHPRMQVRLMGSDGRTDFDRDGVDVGLRYGDGEYREVHCELIARATAFPVCAPALAEILAGDLTRIDPSLLLHDESSLVAPGLPTWNGWLAHAGAPRELERTGGVWFSNSHMALSAAVAGQGFALGLTPLVDDDLKAGRLVRPFPIELTSPFGFWFVCRPDRLAEPKIAKFRRWIFEEAAASRAAGV